MVMQETDYTIPEEIGISIHTDLHNYELLDFPKADEIMKKGYKNTLKFLPQIKALRTTGREQAKKGE